MSDLCAAWFRPGTQDPDYAAIGPRGALCGRVAGHVGDHKFTRVCRPPVSLKTTHLVVIFREQDPTVTGFADIDSARAFYDVAGANWSETFLTEVIAGPLV